jgi:LacI family transcriptional regulator
MKKHKALVVEDSKRQTTQVDIARRADVSTATVSRVLNGSPLVKPKVREHVLTVMADLKYFPHAAARALASSRTYTIGAVIPTLNNSIFAASVNSFEARLQSANYTLLVAVSNYDLAVEEIQLQRLIQRGVEGLLLIGNAHTDAAYRILEDSGVVYVNTWAYNRSIRHPNIGFSNRKAARAIVDHLVALGHRRIGMLAGITDGNDRARDRMLAVREQLAKYGLQLMPEATMEVEYTIPAGRQALARLLESEKLPTALICGNDVVAIGVLFEAQRRGIRVPQELSITGFDNMPLIQDISPRMTTVNVPAQEMGEQAASAILSAIEKGARVRSREIEAQLIVGETTTVPRRRMRLAILPLS